MPLLCRKVDRSLPGGTAGRLISSCRVELPGGMWVGGLPCDSINLGVQGRSPGEEVQEAAGRLLVRGPGARRPRIVCARGGGAQPTHFPPRAPRAPGGCIATASAVLTAEIATMLAAARRGSAPDRAASAAAIVSDPWTIGASRMA